MPQTQMQKYATLSFFTTLVISHSGFAVKEEGEVKILSGMTLALALVTL